MKPENLRIQSISIHSLESDPDRVMVFLDMKDLDVPDAGYNFNRSGTIEYQKDDFGRETVIFRPDRLHWDEIDHVLMDAAEKAGLINTKIFCMEQKKNGPVLWIYKNQPIKSNDELHCILVNLGAIKKDGRCYPCRRTSPECDECTRGELSGDSRRFKLRALK